MAKKLVNLKDNDDILIPKVLGGIDMDNVLYSNINNTVEYTATEDCVVVSIVSGCANVYIYIDGEYIFGAGTTTYFPSVLFLKVGQLFHIDTTNNQPNVTIYGLKY